MKVYICNAHMKLSDVASIHQSNNIGLPDKTCIGNDYIDHTVFNVDLHSLQMEALRLKLMTVQNMKASV